MEPTKGDSQQAKPKEAGAKRKGRNSTTEDSKFSNLINEAKRPRLYPENPVITQLKEDIEKECLLRDGATKLLQAAKTTWQSLEASKGIFVSNAKTLSLMKELQRVKQDQDYSTKKPSDDNNGLKPCMAKIAISDIRIPLEWKRFEQSKGKTDSSQKMGVFCLFRLGNQVMDTPSIVEVDKTTMDISFSETIIFSEPVDQDFMLEVEVYCSSLSSESSSSSSTKPSTPLTPMKMLRKIKKDKNSDSPLPSSALSNYIPASPYVPPMANIGPSHHFTLAGHAHFKLKDVYCSCRTYTLVPGAVGSSGTASTSSACDQPLLPLWGQICCNIMAQPECAVQPRITGFINVQQRVTGLPAWVRLWCVMRQNHMRCWVYPEDVGMKMPHQTIELTQTMVVDNAPRLTMRRPNTLLVRDGNKELFISFESQEDRTEWSAAINQAILDLQVWGDSCNYIISKPASKFYVKDNNSPLPSYNRAETVI